GAKGILLRTYSSAISSLVDIRKYQLVEFEFLGTEIHSNSPVNYGYTPFTNQISVGSKLYGVFFRGEYPLDRTAEITNKIANGCHISSAVGVVVRECEVMENFVAES